MCNQRQFHFKGIPNTTVDCTFSEDFAALKRKKPSLFHSTCSSAVTLPSRLVSWDRFKGLKRQGRKDGVNIDSCFSSLEAIFSDVIRYPKLDIRRTGERSERVSFQIQKQQVRKYRTKHCPCCNLFILYSLWEWRRNYPMPDFQSPCIWTKLSCISNLFA